MRFLLGLQSMQTLLNNGDDLYERGQFSEALHRYELALQKEDAHSSQAARIQHKIGLTLSQLGDSFKSMNCFQVALKIFQDSDDLGPGSQDAAETTAQMIRILDKIRLESGVGERKFVKGAESTHVGVDVGMNLLEWADYKEAEKTLKECLAENGNDDAKSSAVTEDEKVKAICTLGKLSQAQGRYDEAKRLYLEALKNAKQIAGPESEIDEQIVESIAGYAEILRKSGDLWQAEALHKKVRSMLLVLKDKMDDSDSVISEEVSIEHDLRLAVSHTQLGCTYFELRRYDSGLGEHQAALQIRLRHVDGNDALVSESLNYTAETLCALKQYPKALPLSMHAVAIRFREFGPSHPAYAHSLCVLARCYRGVGRSSAAGPLVDRCLDICGATFEDPLHANFIPNLLLRGDIYSEFCNFDEAIKSYTRARNCHTANFKIGQREHILEEISTKLLEAKSKSNGSLSSGGVCTDDRERERAGVPIIVITDVGRDIDDAMALILLASLKRMLLVRPLAVITTLPPEQDRARLARSILDSLGLHDVPVGIGTQIDMPDEKLNLSCFEGVHVGQNDFEWGDVLMSRVLRDAKDCSVKILCIANLKDVSALMVKHKDLCCAKVKEIVLMGGAIIQDGNLQPDPLAFNNHTHIQSANHVFAECLHHNIATTSVSRLAAYDLQFEVSWFDKLQQSQHQLAKRIRELNYKAMETLWRRCHVPPWLRFPGRGLPKRCTRDWFIDFFDVEIDKNTSVPLWQSTSKVFLYDVLTLIASIDGYRDLYFTPKCVTIGGTPHRIIGYLDDDGKRRGCVVNQDHLLKEVQELVKHALEISLEGMVPLSADGETAMSKNETPINENGGGVKVA